MAFINWNDRYLTHVAVFDEHHQRLFQLINDLYEGVMACSNLEEERKITKKTLAELVAYAKEHFTSEESLMEEYSYPEFAKHKQEHEEFFSQLEAFISEYRENAVGLSNEIFIFMREWISKHILETDGYYKEFFQEKGVK